MDADLLFGLVVVIEDDSSHGLLIKRAISAFAKEVLVCNSLKQGLEKLSLKRPDLIVTDLHMPDTKGVEHVSTLLEKGHGAPVIVLTSSTSIQDAVKAMRLGAADYIVKSFDENFQEMIGLTLARLRTSEELKREKKKLEDEMRALRVAIENSQDGMAVVTTEGEILYRNSSFALFVERGGGDLSSLTSVLGAKFKNNQKLQNNLNENLSKLGVGSVWTCEVPVLGEVDASFDLSLSILERLEGVLGKSVVWVRDISEKKRRERFQKEILSTTTHDLKGPLGAIALCGEMLVELVKTPEKAKELTLRVVSSSRGALNLIDEFLSARRIQEGTFILQPAKNDLWNLAENVVAEYQTIALTRKINLSLNKEGSEREVFVDGLAFSRALGNLVSNAIKYTPSGGTAAVTVTVNQGAFTVSVSDSGTGMEPAEAQRVFDKFSRLSKHAEIQGTGLGLYVVRNIVSAHGGSVRVTSEPGKGSVFTLEFPADPPVNDKGQILCLDFA